MIKSVSSLPLWKCFSCLIQLGCFISGPQISTLFLHISKEFSLLNHSFSLFLLVLRRLAVDCEIRTHLAIHWNFLFTDFLFSKLITACLASYGTETVMQLCHGRRRCTISADRANFGNPCRPESRVYLKVVYTCSEYSFTWILIEWKLSNFSK